MSPWTSNDADMLLEVGGNYGSFFEVKNRPIGPKNIPFRDVSFWKIRPWLGPTPKDATEEIAAAEIFNPRRRANGADLH